MIVVSADIIDGWWSMLQLLVVTLVIGDGMCDRYQ